MSFAHLHCHSTYSILDGLPTADKIAARCAELEYPACALTDHASISGAIAFSEKCKKKGIKPILGAEFNITTDSATVQDKSNKVGHQVILAKTLEGWYKLVQLVSRSNTPEYFYYRPRIDIDLLKEIGGDNLVSFSGHLGSTLSNIISDEKKSIAYVELMKEIFGRDNFFIEIQVIDTPNYSYYTLLAEKLRDLAIKTNTKTIATGDSHYIGQEDVEDHRLILCSSMKTTFNDIYKRIAKNEDFSLSSFFKSELFGIPTIEQLKTGGNTEEEIRNTNIIADMCEDYDITSPPRLPKYEWTEGMSEVQYLRELCKRGWRKHKRDDWNIQEYGDRVKKELGVIEGANLAGYFLIVQDYVNHFKNNGMLIGVGRGCLSPDTKIVINNGQMKSIIDIKKGDYVIGSDGESHKVIDTFKYSNNEEMVNIRTFYGHYEGITLTKDHKVLAEQSCYVDNYKFWNERTRSSKRKYKQPTGKVTWIRADKLKKNDWLYFPKIKTKNLSHTFDLADYCTSNDLRYDKEYVYYEPINKLCNVKMFSRQIQRHVVLDNELGFILGIFCGDGWLAFSKKNCIGFAFHKNEKHNLKTVKSFFAKLGCEYRVDVSYKKQLVQLIIKHKAVYKWFESMFCDYRSSLTKHVPECILQATPEVIQNFLRGYLQSDGHESSNKISFCTTSKRLSEETKFLCLCIGVPASTCCENRIGNKNITHLTYVTNCPLNTKFGSKNNKNIYNYKEFNDYILVKILKISYTNNYTNVYDIKVDNIHNYLSSNGVVHNSAAGSLVSYLIGITGIDPIRYNLIFERFFNEARKESMPDIDIDFPTHQRHLILEYLQEKYGKDRVCQIATFGTMQGRGALKEVLRVHKACDAKKMDEITKNIFQEDEINDQLEATGETSILLWMLKYTPEKLQTYCRLNDDGVFIGDYAKYFEQAIRIEGVIRSQGIHAGGIIVSQEPLAKVCPMIRAKDGRIIGGFDKKDIEKAGQVKLDCLGVNAFDKLSSVNNLRLYGKVNP
jgi:intein/homing endonuclease